ncbi:SET domain-containing protein [Meira miltonrushii]|uniref:SET domain-containing protein n=1 Tax=Meira miltonrushii TaxID=1280837 RepID=A0A316V786_9BASI|nr:SET domain-containing protein [Meira miltonrushii]PWN32878.1 SET domain-containing protein [Meira miltonrushii]
MAEPLEGNEKVKLSALLAWLGEEGGKVHDDIYFARDNQMGLSPFASERIDSDAVAVNVPVKSCITTANAKKQVEDLLMAAEEQDDSNDSEIVSPKEWILLYLVLHKLLLSFRKERGSQNRKDTERSSKRTKLDSENVNSFLKHAAYVNLLPEEILTPIHFNIDEIILLQSTPLFNYAIQKHQETRETCERIGKWMLQKLENSSSGEAWIEHLKDKFVSPTSLQSPDITEEQRVQWKRGTGDDLYWCEDEMCWPLLKVWRWAETVHGSRAFPPRLIEAHDSAPILIPCFDLFNHSREAKVTWTFERANAQKDIQQDCATLTVHNRTGKDCQVFNSYGPKSNESLLASYGFVNDSMNDDTVCLKLGQKQTNGATHASDTKERLHYWKYEEECPPDLLEEVINVIRANVDPEEENEDIDRFAPDAGEEEREDIRRKMYEEEAYGIISEMAQKKLQGLQNEMIEEAKKNVNVRPEVLHTIEVYREGQKRVLGWAIEHADQKSLTLGAEMNNAYY